MAPLDQMAIPTAPILLSDIDDTMTLDGYLPADSYGAMWSLYNRGIPVVPVTGRPAGWCEMIARQWPVHGIIGENGALYFRYVDGQMRRHYLQSPNEHRSKLDLIRDEVLREVPGTSVASDQFCRLFDLAIDFCEDVPPLPKSAVDQIVAIFQRHGAVAKVSSIHVNGWYGEHNKLSTAAIYLEKEFQLNAESMQERAIYIGDSPNDEPMFGHFQKSVGVANIQEFQLDHPPKHITRGRNNLGFVELIEAILNG